MKVAESAESNAPLTMPEAVVHSGYSRATIYRWIKAGEISVITENGQTKILPDQLDRASAKRASVSNSLQDAQDYAEDQSAAKRLAARAPKLSEAKRQHLAALVTPLVITAEGGGAQ